MNDPRPYEGPIERADGKRPFNRYLWPTEQWVAYLTDDTLLRQVSFQYRVEIIALADGRFSTDGFVSSIEDEAGRCVFATRNAAIRASAAAMIRQTRRDRTPPEYAIHVRPLPEKTCAALVDWARQLVARETGAEPPRPITLRPLPKPPVKTGLPLFDIEEAKTR